MLLRVRLRWIETFAVPILINHAKRTGSLYRSTATFSIKAIANGGLEIVLPCPTLPSPSEDLPRRPSRLKHSGHKGATQGTLRLDPIALGHLTENF